MAITVAVDAMGGDLAPGVVIAGSLQAVQRLGIEVVLVGPEDVVRAELANHGPLAPLRLSVVDAPDVISMGEPPLAALRRKPRASVKVAAELVASGDAHAMFSAGHTGAAFLAAHQTLGVLAGVERPALAVTLPTRRGASILVDAGANVDCRPQHLRQFGIMGAAYARLALQAEHPTVGLLSIGEEVGKGSDLYRDAHTLLADSGINFIGNIEAGDLFTGKADVIVCDGFTGNVALKVGEGLVEFVEHMLREELGPTFPDDPRRRDAFKRFRQRVDYAERGGAPLLGVKALAVIGHGRSSAYAIQSGIGMAARLAEQKMVEQLAAALAPEEPGAA
jgi:glycerol-3-phosphate acyltransferase PlsX